MRIVLNLFAGATVVFLLALFLFPTERCGKACSASTASMANAKMLALGLVAYTGDHDDRFARRDFWMDDLAPYVKEEGVYHVPRTPKGTYGYAFNATLDAAKPPKKSDTTPLVYESANPIRNASDLVASLPRPGRYRGRNAIAYADGHVRRVAVEATP